MCSLRYLNGRTLSPFPAEAGQHKYCEWLENTQLIDEGVNELPEVLGQLKNFLRLESKLSKDVVVAEQAE
jgi:hypothetical protein